MSTVPNRTAGSKFLAIIKKQERNRKDGYEAMKLIIAYIQPHKLSEVKEALLQGGVAKMSVTNSLGCGQQQGFEESYRGVRFDITLLKKVRIEIAVNDQFAQQTIDVIMDAARTGDIGDGKIFILPLEECIRIRTGERGRNAIG